VTFREGAIKCSRPSGCRGKTIDIASFIYGCFLHAWWNAAGGYNGAGFGPADAQVGIWTNNLPYLRHGDVLGILSQVW
jgi:hypothetical protein